MDESRLKTLVYTEISTVLSALGEPRRIAILDLLSQCERHVEEAAQMLGLGVTTVSHHLQVLKRARLVHERKDGRYRYYSASHIALSLWGVISRIASEELAEVKFAVEQISREDGDSTPVDYREAMRRVQAGEAVLVDVRPREEFDAGHAPQAISVPADILHSLASDLPRGKTVFAYCRGRYCMLSRDAVAALQKRGIDARRLEDGIAEWKADGITLHSSLD
jgi:rhodanese-related sulfurtransferase/predicted transcriptional regulator